MYKIRAVYRSFGTNLPTDGPGLSARIRLMCDAPLSGITARRNTRTPIPPIQWVKLLQNSVQWESASTSFKMVVPVVVKPEIVSKRASVKDGISLEITNGKQPKKLKKIQLKEVVRQPSFK